MAAALAKRYAGALVDVVTGPKSEVDPQNASAQLRRVEETFRASDELRNALSSPAVPPARKRAVVSRMAEMLGVSRSVRNFLLVLIDHRRVGLLAEIAEAFDVLLDERLGVARAQVTAARELSDAQKARLQQELSRLTGRPVRLRYAVDPQLIGGVVARIGSTVYDGSVAGQLEALNRRLRAE
ncbi:MAG: ATP synthase F1 subunit delta [Bryobacterales bacterium]|nr:ATP synthase F1 subunit delta [Bryobacterales bacterium]